MDKKSMEVLRMELNSILADFAKTRGLNMLKLGNGSYSPNGGSFRFKLEGIESGGKSPEESFYELVAQSNFKLPVLHGIVYHPTRNESYEVMGMTPRRKILLRRISDGKMFSGSVEQVHVMRNTPSENTSPDVVMRPNSKSVRRPMSPERKAQLANQLAAARAVAAAKRNGA